MLTTFLCGAPFHSIAAELKEVGTIVLPHDSATYDSKKKRFEQSHNLSGMFCPAPDWCIVVSDERRGIHRLNVTRGAESRPQVTFGTSLKLEWPSKKFLKAHGLDDKPRELDLEAIASTGDTLLFLGSHGNKRMSGKINPGSHLVAIASVSDLKSKDVVPAKWASLDKLFRRDLIGEVLNKPLQCGGLNIEGATVLGDRLLIGIRIPTKADGPSPATLVVSTPYAGLLKEDFSEAKPHPLPTQQSLIGIRAMETVGDAVLVVTGDAGVSDLKDDSACATNLYKEDPARPFELRVWRPAKGDFFETEPRITFATVTEMDADNELSPAKLEGIAADPARPGAFFILYDGSDKVRYLEGLKLQ
ncbi:DUF3616 domain-containing protein [Pseudaminobacter sp. 19-2017]|uniref:DUF3616 domain-containing protein n=1 Tax=Pseudaminobacter soli (ex Zhang et al. 2022) TaxID=2831468 RepID=A0A942E4N5_9HYPH|nr:DUF3616 domain-containing protein [Pseudaminobacter soli]MBS3648432.1 DUF3616 domain-containing protein [Pseudaminobacter soli]